MKIMGNKKHLNAELTAGTVQTISLALIDI